MQRNCGEYVEINANANANAKGVLRHSKLLQRKAFGRFIAYQIVSFHTVVVHLEHRCGCIQLQYQTAFPDPLPWSTTDSCLLILCAQCSLQSHPRQVLEVLAIYKLRR